MYERHGAFMAWAESYDLAEPPVRSRRLHEQWLQTLPCPVWRLSTKRSTEALVDAVLAAS